MNVKNKICSGKLMDANMQLSLLQLCRLCDIDAHYVAVLVEEGVIEPLEDNSPFYWRFDGLMTRRVQVAVRLRRDLDINPPGIALVIDLLDELQELRQLKKI